MRHTVLRILLLFFIILKEIGNLDLCCAGGPDGNELPPPHYSKPFKDIRDGGSNICPPFSLVPPTEENKKCIPLAAHPKLRADLFKQYLYELTYNKKLTGSGIRQRIAARFLLYIHPMGAYIKAHEPLPCASDLHILEAKFADLMATFPTERHFAQTAETLFYVYTINNYRINNTFLQGSAFFNLKGRDQINKDANESIAIELGKLLISQNEYHGIVEILPYLNEDFKAKFFNSLIKDAKLFTYNRLANVFELLHTKNVISEKDFVRHSLILFKEQTLNPPKTLIIGLSKEAP